MLGATGAQQVHRRIDNGRNFARVGLCLGVSQRLLDRLYAHDRPRGELQDTFSDQVQLLLAPVAESYPPSSLVLSVFSNGDDLCCVSDRSEVSVPSINPMPPPVRWSRSDGFTDATIGHRI